MRRFQRCSPVLSPISRPRGSSGGFTRLRVITADDDLVEPQTFQAGFRLVSPNRNMLGKRKGPRAFILSCHRQTLPHPCPAKLRRIVDPIVSLITQSQQKAPSLSSNDKVKCRSAKSRNAAIAGRECTGFGCGRI